jgi:hypothetical protein
MQPMHASRFLLIIAACAAAAGPLPAASRTGNALSLLDAFVAAEARDRPGLRADVRPGADPQGTPPGRVLAFSAILGPFTYRPRSWAELSPADRAALLRDPGLKPFLAANPGKPVASPSRVLFITADEMLRLGPLLVPLPRREAPP